MPARPGRHRRTAVVAGWIRGPLCEGRWMDSMLDVLDYDAKHQRYLDRDSGGGRISLQSSPRIAEARSQVVDAFLAGFPKAEWLWWTDADATFEGDVLAQLMDVADAKERPIVGALAFAGYQLGQIYPTVYQLEREPSGAISTSVVREYPRNALLKVGGTGCHCVVVHRQVFVAMAKAYAFMPDGTTRNPTPWYMEGLINKEGHAIGEDLAFCMRAAHLGIPTHIHTGIRTGHVKQLVLTEEMWDLQQADQRRADNQRAYRDVEAEMAKLARPTLELVKE